MKAMVIKAFGGPEVFEPRELPRPEPGPGELLVRVRATSVNPVDFKIRRAGGWAGVKPPAVIGWDAAGVVEGVGPGVRDFRAGDEVFYSPDIFAGPGSDAEYHVADERIVDRKPASLSFEEAASLPLAGGTAWDGLVVRGAVRPGETVLIHGAGGGVGSLAVQIARACGARVVATTGAASLSLVRALGAAAAVDHRAAGAEAALREAVGREGVDVVYDCVGGDWLERSLPLVKEHGRLVTIVESVRFSSFDELFGRNLALHFEFAPRRRDKLEGLRKLVEAGLLRPVVDAVLPLAQVAEAHRRLEAGGLKGKIVLVP
jgi:NADPH:quinone reductase